MRTLKTRSSDPWYFGAVLAYCFIVFAGGHTGLFMGIAVPVFWSAMVFSHGRPYPLETGPAAMSLLAGAAVVAGSLSVLFDAGSGETRFLQTVSIVFLVLSALVACWVSDAPIMSAMSVAPFAGAAFGYFLFARDPRDASALH